MNLLQALETELLGESHGGPSRVVWEFLHWLLTDYEINPGILSVIDSKVARCAEIVERRARGETVLASDAENAAAIVWDAVLDNGLIWGPDHDITEAANSASCAAEVVAWEGTEEAVNSLSNVIWSVGRERGSPAWLRMAHRLEELMAPFRELESVQLPAQLSDHHSAPCWKSGVEAEDR